MQATRISFSYPQKMKDKLQLMAEKDCRSLSSYIQRVLADHIEANPVEEKKSEKPKKVARRSRKKITK